MLLGRLLLLRPGRKLDAGIRGMTDIFGREAESQDRDLQSVVDVLEVDGYRPSRNHTAGLIFAGWVPKTKEQRWRKCQKQLRDSPQNSL